MKSGHTKTHTVDSASLQKILKSQRNNTDENTIFQNNRSPIFSTSTNPFANRVLTSCNFENGRTLTVDYGDKGRKSPNMLETTSSHLKTEDSVGNDIYADMVGKINSLNAEVSNYKNREKKFLAKISSLENEKGLLIQALEQTQKKLQDTAQKSKEDKKRMNIIIESFKQSIQSMEKPKSTKETQTSDQTLQTSFMDRSSSKGNIYNAEYAKNFEILIEKLEELTTHSNSLVEENCKLRTEVDSYKKYSDTLKSYIEHHKSQIAKQENAQSSLLERSNAVVNENVHYKDFVKTLLHTRKHDGGLGHDPRSDPSRDSNGKYGKIVKAMPSYLKAMSMTLREGNEE
jgi:hypothetical protein